MFQRCWEIHRSPPFVATVFVRKRGIFYEKCPRVLGLCVSKRSRVIVEINPQILKEPFQDLDGTAFDLRVVRFENMSDPALCGVLKFVDDSLTTIREGAAGAQGREMQSPIGVNVATVTLIQCFHSAVKRAENGSLKKILVEGCRPLKTLSIPISDIGDVEDSVFWQGYVVRLTKPRAALTQFVVPWYFGPQREDLIRAIRLVTGQLTK